MESPDSTPGERPEEQNSPTLKAQSLFADWLMRCEDGSGEPFEELRGAHPELDGRFVKMQEGLADAGLFPGPLEEEHAAEASPRSAVRGWRHPPTRALLGALLSSPSPEERYEFVKELGRGGMGAVEQVFEPRLRRFLAKKVIYTEAKGGLVPDTGAGYERALARFFEEAQVTAQLTHPGVVPVHELGVDAGGDVYFTMDRVGGMDLADAYSLHRKGDESWSLTRLAGVLQRVCETMAFAHSRGVLHRDLKPANVMVGEFGEVYVMDWGLARVLGQDASRGGVSSARSREDVGSAEDSSFVESPRRGAGQEDSPFLTQRGAAQGTPSFMPPEQAKGQLDLLDARTDVYAVGAMLYALLAGRVPYADVVGGGAGDVLMEVAQRSPTAVAKLAPDAPQELLAICEKAMQRERDARYGDMRALAEDLRAWLEGRVVSAYEQGAWAEAKKWVRRNKGWSISAAAGLLALFGGVSGMLVIEAAGRSALETERDVTQLARGPQDVRILLEDTELLWPVAPERAEELAYWLERADGVLGSWDFYEEGLVALREGTAGTLFEGAQLAAGLEPAVSEMVEQREVLASWRGKMAARFELASTLEERTVTGKEARAAWSKAAEDIAGREVYAGLQLVPQLGLLPLRVDPRTGLWEFWAVATGARPELDGETDRWVVSGDIGVVLVLVPGGEATVGALLVAEDGSNWGEPFVDNVFYGGDDNERPLRHARLDPFFVAKYETTVGQWCRALDEEPLDPELVGFPVVNVTHAQCVRAAANLALALPTEARWEYACRAGTSTPYSMPGAAEFDLRGELSNATYQSIWKWAAEFANCGKQNKLIAGGALAPNPWGLHDVHGNVWEWVLDDYALPAAAALATGDGATKRTEGAQHGVLRGGGWGYSDYGPWDARSAKRLAYAFANFDQDLGVRFVRSIDRE